MGNKIKILWMKFLTVNGFLLYGLSFTLPWILHYNYGYPYKSADRLMLILYLSGSFLGLLLILSPFVIPLKPEVVKADKYVSLYASFETLKEQCFKELSDKGYSTYKSDSLNSHSEIILYVKSFNLKQLDCFAIIRTDELTDDFVETANDRISEFISSYYNKPIERITDTVNMISLFCVNRITPSFRKLLDTPAVQGLKNGRLPVGISFGGKKIYVPKDQSGFFSIKRNTKIYKRLREELFEILKIQEQL